MIRMSKEEYQELIRLEARKYEEPEDWWDEEDEEEGA
jgi:hypothetical protein